MVRASRWLVVPVVAVLAVSPLHRADAQMISFGLMAGGSLSTFTGDAYNDVKNYAGFIGGGFVRIGALGFAVQPGVYYTTKGVKSTDFSETTGSKQTLDYIQVPLVLRLSLPMHLYVGAGPAVGVKIGCKFVSNENPEFAITASSDCADYASVMTVKSTEISGIAEAGLQFGKFSLGARADLGLTNAIESVQSGSTANLDVKTRTISAVAAIRF